MAKQQNPIFRNKVNSFKTYPVYIEFIRVRIRRKAAKLIAEI